MIFFGLGAILAVLYLLFFIGRFVICYKRGGICGKRYPTETTRKRSKCGYEMLLAVWNHAHSCCN